MAMVEANPGSISYGDHETAHLCGLALLTADSRIDRMKGMILQDSLRAILIGLDKSLTNISSKQIRNPNVYI
jgi:hypothetical protein